MSKELVSSIDIAAPAERVWEVLVDFAAFPAWNPFITQAEGRLEVGGRLTLRMQPVGGSAVTLRPTVVEVVDGQRLRWQGRLGSARAVRRRPSVHRGAAGCGRVATCPAGAVQRPAGAVLSAVAGPWHVAGVPRDERGTEGPGGEGDRCT